MRLEKQEEKKYKRKITAKGLTANV